MMRIVKTTFQNHEEPDHFEIYVRHDFANGTFIALYKLKPRPLSNPEFRIGAPILTRRRTWMDYGINRGYSANPLVDGRSFDDDTKAWLDFAQTTNDILDGSVAIIAEQDEDSEDFVTLEIY